MSTKKTSIEREEVRRRIDALEEPFKLAHRYARVERATLMPDGRPETDGEHGISLALIATAYALKYHPELDPYKVFFYGVMHDIDEFLHGDTPTLGATDTDFRRKDAEEAEGAVERGRILHDFPELNHMIDSLADLSVPENAFGKAFDKLAPGYTHAANAGRALKRRYNMKSYEDILEATAATDKKMLSYAAKFVDVLVMRQEMHRKVAEQAFGDDLPAAA